MFYRKMEITTKSGSKYIVDLTSGLMHDTKRVTIHQLTGHMQTTPDGGMVFRCGEIDIVTTEVVSIKVS